MSVNLLQQIAIILLIFYGTAYISITSKETGLFAFIAEKTLLGKWKGRQLSFIIFIVAGVLCFLTDNDVVILTLTPMLVHLHGPHDMRKLLLIQFAAANTFSLFSLVSNPTNVIIANQFNIDYIGFVELMWPLGILAAISVILLVPKARGTITLKVQRLTRPHMQTVLSGIGIAVLLSLFLTERLTNIPLWLIVVMVLSLFVFRDVFTGKMKLVLSQLPVRPGIVITSGFIIAWLLEAVGATEYVAVWLSGFSFIPAALIVTVLSVLVAAAIVNIPMAILMSTILLKVDFPVAQQVALVSLVFMASDISTLIFRRASLAGHMWQHMIEQGDGETITRRYFAQSLAPAGLLACIVTFTFVIFRVGS